MIYKYAAKLNYEYLAAGGVLKSYQGNTNFPVRLGHEIFNRCLEHCEGKEQISFYDPMCGSGYLLTTIAVLNFEKIQSIYASDIDLKVLEVAKKNLRLLTKEGISERQEEIKAMIELYDRASHKTNLAYIKNFEETVAKDIPFDVFQRDLFSDPLDSKITPDIVMMDLPYDKVVSYKGAFSENNLKNQIAALIQNKTVVAVIKNKIQKLKIELQSNRLEKFNIGKRIVEIYGTK